MNCFAIGYDGTSYSLPTVTQWRFQYGLGTPCDSFEVTCLWSPGDEKTLTGAVRFQAEHNGQRVFTGVVDEFSCLQDAKGCRMELSGRGMQALLLDNQALSVEYRLATVGDILRRHVSPYGISLAGNCPLGAVAGFSVSSGQSEWSVVHDFACYHGGIVPRFDRNGNLLLSNWDNTRRRLGDGAKLTSLRYAYRRYGVLSQVVVRDKPRNYSETVNDSEFQSQGGLCRRVISTSGRSSAPAMRLSGQYQLRASRTQKETCEITIPQGFAAWPGDLIDLDRTGFGGNGLYRVREAVVSANEKGLTTKLTLGPVDLLV